MQLKKRNKKLVNSHLSLIKILSETIFLNETDLLYKEFMYFGGLL